MDKLSAASGAGSGPKKMARIAAVLWMTAKAIRASSDAAVVKIWFGFGICGLWESVKAGLFRPIAARSATVCAGCG